MFSFIVRKLSKAKDAVTDDECHLMDTRALALAIRFSNTKTVPPTGSSPGSDPNFSLLSSYQSGSAHSRLLGCAGILVSFFLSGIDTDCLRVVHMSLRVTLGREPCVSKIIATVGVRWCAR